MEYPTLFGQVGSVRLAVPLPGFPSWILVKINPVLAEPRTHEQGHLPLDQVAQSSIQYGLEHFQGGGIHSFSGKPVPVPHHPHGKEFLPNI